MYTGKPLDSLTGLYYYNARLYDPTIGRFLTEDTYTGSESDPLSLNRYIYARDNPEKYNDPNGHMFTTATGGGGSSNTGSGASGQLACNGSSCGTVSGGSNPESMTTGYDSMNTLSCGYFSCNSDAESGGGPNTGSITSTSSSTSGSSTVTNTISSNDNLIVSVDDVSLLSFTSSATSDHQPTSCASPDVCPVGISDEQGIPLSEIESTAVSAAYIGAGVLVLSIVPFVAASGIGLVATPAAVALGGALIVGGEGGLLYTSEKGTSATPEEAMQTANNDASQSVFGWILENLG